MYGRPPKLHFSVLGHIGRVEDEVAALAEERQRVVVHHAADETLRVAATTHFENEVGNGSRRVWTDGPK